MARISRKELKRDELIEATKGFEHWVTENASMLARAAVVVVVLGIVAAGWFWIAQRNREQAAQLLAQTQRRLGAAEVAGFADRAELESILADFSRAARKGAGGTGLLGSYYEGLVLHRLGRDAEAAEALDRITASAGVPPTLAGASQALLATVHLSRGDTEKAIEVFQRLIAADPPSFPVDQALLKLGKIHLARGEDAAARAAWQRIIDDYAVQGAADEARKLLGS